MIDVQNVKKAFNEVNAINGVSLHVPKGQVKALLGPNGAGKTTLVRIMTTLLRPDEGSVEIAGFNALKEQEELRTKIGLAGQYAAVDENLTGYENLYMFSRLYHLPRKEAEARAANLLEEFHLQEAADRPAKTYSGGMRRRLDLAASLIAEPPVIFLDEPTTGLDPAARRDLWDIIRSLVDKGTTILLTTQYLEEADQLADSIAVLNKGKIIAEGTADELKAASGGNVLEVTLKNEADVESARSILSKIGGQGLQEDREQLHFTVPIEGNANSLVEVVRSFDASGIGIVDIQLRRPTLDDVFLALTGSSAESLAEEQVPTGKTMGKKSQH